MELANPAQFPHALAIGFTSWADSPAAQPVQVQVRNGAVQFEYNLPAPQVVELTAGDGQLSVAGLMDDPPNTVRNYFPAEGEFGTIYV